MKGVYLRSSAYTGERIQTSEMQSAGPGYLIVTTKNLFFYGSEIVKIPLKSETLKAVEGNGRKVPRFCIVRCPPK